MEIVGQPVSWGVNYLPGWGHQLSADRVLGEMRELGLAATEYQPGLFPENAGEAVALLSRYELVAAAGWAAVILHARRPKLELERFAARVGFLAAIGARVVNVGAVTEVGSFESRVELSTDDWQRFYASLRDAEDIAGEAGVQLALHPHVGTAVETPDDVRRVLDNTEARFCYDAGHLYCGGGEPLELARMMSSRLVNVHLKDVDVAIAEDLRTGHTSWSEAVGAGMFRPLGEGDLPLAEIIGAIAAQYDGAVVIEQDVRLTPENAHAPLADMRLSMDFLRRAWPQASDRR